MNTSNETLITSVNEPAATVPIAARAGRNRRTSRKLILALLVLVVGWLAVRISGDVAQLERILDDAQESVNVVLPSAGPQSVAVAKS